LFPKVLPKLFTPPIEDLKEFSLISYLYSAYFIEEAK